MNKELDNPQNHEVRRLHLPELTRLKRIFEARAAGPKAAAEMEATTAAEILGSNVDATKVCQMGQRPFEAAEFVGSAFAGAIAGLAIEHNRKVPPATKYSPMHSSDAMFRAIWKLREVMDELEVPYDFYIAHSFEFLGRRIGARLPTPSRLMEPDVVAYVMASWSAYQASKVSLESGRHDMDEKNDSRAMQN